MPHPVSVGHIAGLLYHPKMIIHMYCAIAPVLYVPSVHYSKLCDVAAERLPPSKLLQLTNQILLGSFAGLRAAGQAASWAHVKVMHQLYGGKTFPLQVRTSSGHFTTVVAVCLSLHAMPINAIANKCHAIIHDC